MFNDLKLGFPAPQLWRSAASVLALVLICAPLTIGAIWAFPIWDDAWLWLLLKENGAGTIAASVADRPVMAALWWLLAASDRRILVGLVCGTGSPMATPGHSSG